VVGVDDRLLGGGVVVEHPRLGHVAGDVPAGGAYPFGVVKAGKVEVAVRLETVVHRVDVARQVVALAEFDQLLAEDGFDAVHRCGSAHTGPLESGGR